MAKRQLPTHSPAFMAEYLFGNSGLKTSGIPPKKTLHIESNGLPISSITNMGEKLKDGFRMNHHFDGND